MSDGIRSGVNWIRLSISPKTVPSERASRVLASPGRPMTRAWPPASSVMIAWSTTCGWPNTSSAMWARARATASFAASIRATNSSVWGTAARGEGWAGGMSLMYFRASLTLDLWQSSGVSNWRGQEQ